MITAEGSDFSSLAKAALAYLRLKLGFGVWMVTRTEADAWIVLQAEDHNYGLARHATFRWEDSFCSRMASGAAPRIAPSVAAVPAFQAVRLREVMDVGAYVGVPMRYPDGSLFGTLCAFDSNPQPSSIETELPLVEMMADMLSGVLAAELRAIEVERERERTAAGTETDLLTGLYKCHVWDRFLSVEESRCRRYGHAACVVLVDLDGVNAVNEVRGESVGDKLIRRAARVLLKTVRASDVVARVGGDKFAVLGVQCNPKSADVLAQRIRKELERAGVSASVGMSSRVPGIELEEVRREADDSMLDEKISRKLRKSAIDMRRFSRSRIYRPKAF